MKQVFTSKLAVSGGWGGEDLAPFVVRNDTSPFGATSTTVRMPTAGTIRNLRIVLSTAFGAGTSGTFRFMKGGVAQALSVTIADTGTSGTDLVNEFTVAENDEITIDCVRTGATAATTMWFSYEFEPTNANESIYAVCNPVAGPNNGANPTYGRFVGGDEWLASAVLATGDAVQRCYVSAAGSFTKATVRLSTAPGSGNSWTYRLVKNGVLQDGSGSTVDTTLTIADAATTGTATFDLPVIVGDSISVQCVATSSPSSSFCAYLLLFEATNAAGAVHLASGQVGQPTASATRYNYPIGARKLDGWDATEANRELIGGETAITLTGWTIRQPGHSSAGNVTYMCRVNGADTGLTITIPASLSDQEETVSGNVEIGPGDTWAVQAVVDGTIGATATPDWTWIAAGPPTSRNNLLLGASHTVTGSNNFVTGASGTVEGDRNVLLALREGSPAPSVEGDGVFAVFADEFIFDGLPTSDPGVAGRLWSDGGTLKVSAG